VKCGFIDNEYGLGLWLYKTNSGWFFRIGLLKTSYIFKLKNPPILKGNKEE